MTFFDRFLSFLKSEKRYSPHTIVAYQSDLEQFDGFLQNYFGTKEVHLATAQMIRSWIVQMIEEGLDSRSVNRKLSTLKSYFKFLMREGAVVENPTSKIVAPKMAKKLPSFVPEKDMDELFEEIHFEKNFEGSRDRLILDLFYSTGMRRSELIQLKVDDVDLSGSALKVLGKRNKERIVPIHPRLAQQIQQYLQERKDQSPEDSTLFITTKGKKMYPELIYRLVRKYLDQVTTIQKKSPHVLRHTFATHMLNNGADLNSIKELLGHANLSATQVYTHNSMEKLKSIYQQAHPKA